MKGVFWIRDEASHARSDQRETNLAKAVRAGAARHGDEIEIKLKRSLFTQDDIPDCDMILGIGVKSRELFRGATAKGISWTYFDKGYERRRDDNTARGWLEYWRVSTNGHQPEKYVAIAKHGPERANGMGYSLAKRRTEGDCVLVDGSSAKHWWFVGAVPMMDKPAQNEYAQRCVERLVADVKAKTKRKIVLRPKQSWHEARAVNGVEFVMGRKDPVPDLMRSHVVVTYGSNLCHDAILMGVPAIVIGDGVARCVSSTSLDDIETPRWASEPERRQWLNNTAWCQFKLEEYESGKAWEIAKAMDACSRS